MIPNPLVQSLSPYGVGDRLGVPPDVVVRWCRSGRIHGVWFDRVTWQWRIPLPLRLRFGKRR